MQLTAEQVVKVFQEEKAKRVCKACGAFAPDGATSCDRRPHPEIRNMKIGCGLAETLEVRPLEMVVQATRSELFLILRKEAEAAGSWDASMANRCWKIVDTAVAGAKLKETTP